MFLPSLLSKWGHYSITFTAESPSHAMLTDHLSWRCQENVMTWSSRGTSNVCGPRDLFFIQGAQSPAEISFIFVKIWCTLWWVSRAFSVVKKLNHPEMSMSSDCHPQNLDSRIGYNGQWASQVLSPIVAHTLTRSRTSLTSFCACHLRCVFCLYKVIRCSCG